MNLNFIHPSLLFGLFACAIPIVIHLIFRKRFKKIKWAAMKFLLAANKNTKTSLLLENLLLLLLRILIVLLLVFVFARPVARMTPLFGAAHVTENLVLVIDTSYSMAIRGANVSPFESAKKQARAILEKAGKNDTVSLMTMNEQTRELLSFVPLGSEKKKAEVLQVLEEITVSDMGTQVEIALENLKQVVDQKEYPNKHLFILTDCQKNAWERAFKKANFIELLKYIKSKTVSFSVVDVSVPNPENIGAISVENEGVVGIGENTRFVANIRNYGAKVYTDVPVNFYVDGKKQKTDYVSLMARQDAEVSFYPSFVSKGSHYVTVEVNADNLLQDNKRHLCFQVIDKIGVLVIDGEPKEGPFESETDYLMAAIGNAPESLLKPTRYNLGDLPPEIKFQDYDVVILANVQTFDNEKRFGELENFVEKGGGLFIWMGDKVSFEYYNQEFFKPGREILPAEIGGSPMGETAKKDDLVFTLQEVSQHRVWRFFHLNQRLMEDLKKCFVYRFFPVKLDPQDKNVSVLASLNDPKKTPLILERKFGQGRVILSTTTIDRAWNNFHTDQYGHIFVIMIHEFLQYLVSRPQEENNIAVGMPILKVFNFFVQDAQITPEDGVPTRPNIQPLEKGAAHRIHYGNTTKSGTYRLELTVPPQVKEERPDIDTLEYFATNVDPEEGDVTALPRQELTKYLKSMEMEYEQDLVSKAKEREAKKDVEYWQEILLATLLFTAFESALATWFGRYK